MERIDVRCGQDGFLLLDGISKMDSETIEGQKEFSLAPVHLCIESLAQLGAFHVRYLTSLEKHAFLLGIKRCTVAFPGPLSGTYRLSGVLTGRSTSAFSYVLHAQKAGVTEIEGEFLFAMIGYDSSFDQAILTSHYRRVFSCLRSASKTDC